MPAALGELEWNKSYNFGVNTPNPFTNSGGAFASKVIQLNNDNYFISGGTIRDTINSPYIFVTNSTGDSLSFQTTEDYRNIQLVNDRIWGIRKDIDLQQSFLSELDEMGNLVSETSLENANSRNLLVGPDENVFNRTGLLFRKYNLNGEIIVEQDSDSFSPEFFITNELAGMTVFGDQLIKFDSDLNIMWELEYEELFPWASPFSSSPNYEKLVRTQSNDYIISGSVLNDNGESVGVFLYKYLKDGDFFWGGIYPFDILPYNYIKGLVEVEDGIVTLGGNRYTNKIELIKLYPNGLNIPTNTTEIEFTTTDFRIFPNPVSSQLTIEFSDATTGQVQLINAQGQMMTTENIFFTKMHQLSLQNYPSGIYVVKVLTEQGNINSQTIIKQ